MEVEVKTPQRWVQTQVAPGRTGVFEHLGVGDILADRYRLVRTVGRGGMGCVWEGVHVNLGTPVAIKLINPWLVEHPEARTRFMREAQAAASLRSPDVVQTFDYGLHGTTPYIAMELLEGESLAHRLARDRRLTPTDALRLLTPVFRATAKGHEADVVHRDLKPDNIFIVSTDGTETTKVLDFGIAKGLSPEPAETSTRTGAVLGTPMYMSPERLVNAGPIDARADLWSLAVIAYECLVGERPFGADSLGGMAVAVMTETAPVPSEHGPVPDGFDAWFAHATRRDPDDRFQDARDMLEALTAIIAGHGEPIVFLSAQGPRRAPIWRRIAIAIALGLAVGTGAWLLGGPAPSEPHMEIGAEADAPSVQTSTATVVPPAIQEAPPTANEAAPPGDPPPAVGLPAKRELPEAKRPAPKRNPRSRRRSSAAKPVPTKRAPKRKRLNREELEF